MTPLRQRMIADMKLYGLAPGTQQVYLKAVQRLAAHYFCSPDQLSEQQLRDYFLYLVEEKQVPSSTLRTEIFGVKFLFDKSLQRPWPTLRFLRARPRAKLPVVLDRGEAHCLIDHGSKRRLSETGRGHSPVIGPSTSRVQRGLIVHVGDFDVIGVDVEVVIVVTKKDFD